MAKFLNTDLINQWIPRLISESQKELLIIVPYIKTSNLTYQLLFEADQRGVEITVIYRENKLNQSEKEKLNKLKNLNLLCHPNIHAKCYFNEKNMIICSMNLYEYSELNNREMGVLLYKENVDTLYEIDDPMIFQDAIEEIQQIFNSSQFEKYSLKAQNQGYKKELIKSDKDLAEERCKRLMGIFVNKKFEAQEQGASWVPICRNYYDRIDLSLEHRAVIKINFDENRLLKIYNSFKPYNQEGLIPGFKFYWSYHLGAITLYRDTKKDKSWDTLSKVDDMKKVKSGIDELIQILKVHLY